RPLLFKEQLIYEQLASQSVHGLRENLTCVWSRQPLKLNSCTPTPDKVGFSPRPLRRLAASFRGDGRLRGQPSGWQSHRPHHTGRLSSISNSRHEQRVARNELTRQLIARQPIFL